MPADILKKLQGTFSYYFLRNFPEGCLNVTKRSGRINHSENHYENLRYKLPPTLNYQNQTFNSLSNNLGNGKYLIGCTFNIYSLVELACLSISGNHSHIAELYQPFLFCRFACYNKNTFITAYRITFHIFHPEQQKIQQCLLIMRSSSK